MDGRYPRVYILLVLCSSHCDDDVIAPSVKLQGGGSFDECVSKHTSLCDTRVGRFGERRHLFHTQTTPTPSFYALLNRIHNLLVLRIVHHIGEVCHSHIPYTRIPIIPYLLIKRANGFKDASVPRIHKVEFPFVVEVIQPRNLLQ